MTTVQYVVESARQAQRRRLERNRRRNAARIRALGELQRRHPEEYADLYAGELREVGLA